MTLELGGALLLQLASVALLRIRFGPQWLGRPYSVYVLTTLVYHGLSEIILRLSDVSKVATWRPPVGFDDFGVFVAATALLATTVGYIWATGRGNVIVPVDLIGVMRGLDMRILAMMFIPLFTATVVGQGYNSGTALQGQGFTLSGFASAFFVPVLSLLALSIVARLQRHYCQRCRVHVS